MEVDYYNATSLLGLTDEELIQRTLQTYLAACQPAYGLCQVQDASVLRHAFTQNGTLLQGLSPCVSACLLVYPLQPCTQLRVGVCMRV